MYNIEAEQSLLGAIISNNEYLNRVSEFLLPEHFYEVAHQKIYSQIISSLEKSKITANQITLKQFFDNDEDLKELGGNKYISILLQQASSVINILDYAKTIYNLALKRKIKIELEQSINDLTTKPIEEIKNDIVESFDKMQILDQDKTISLIESIKIAFEKKPEFINSGYQEVDNIIDGLSYGSFIVIAGRPAMGKSALAMNIGINIAKKSPVLLFSLEMGHEEISKRTISSLSRIHLSKLRHNNITNKGDQQAFNLALEEINQIDLTIKDRGGININQVRSEIKRFVKNKKGKLVIIDYIQLIRPVRMSNRVQEITEITTSLKSIAMEFKIVIIGLSQLSRAVEQREDKRPLLSDLRDSGSIEQDADLVMFVYRPEYYLEALKLDESDKGYHEWIDNCKKLKGICNIIVAKNRSGKCGDANLHFEGEHMLFSNLTTT